MVNIAERAFGSLFPSAEELWERGGADVVAGIPYYSNLEVSADPVVYDTRALYKKDGFRRRKVGSSMLLGYIMSDGIDRIVSLTIPDDDQRVDADLLATTSTAWTTTVGGYVKGRDEHIVREVGIPTISVGAEGSTHTRMLSADQLASVSLAKAAQSEQAILADMSERFDLPTRHYAMGDSRGAMIKPAHSLYAPSYGNRIAFTDIKAPCVPDRLELKDMPKVALWAGVEAIGATAVTASLLAERNIGVLAGTFDAHPRSVPVSVAAIMPALMSGEAGYLLQQVSDDMTGHVVLYGLDVLSSIGRWLELYVQKPNMTVKNVPRGSHAHLLSRNGLQVERVKRATQSLGHDGQLDVEYVAHGHALDNKKQAELRLVVNH